MSKPALTGHKHYRQGVFKLKNPQKYDGDPNNVIYRSNLEHRFMKIFDEQPAILAWTSEELVINYYSKFDGKVRRYFPDVVLKVRDKDNKERILVIEIKPEGQTVKPNLTGKGRKAIREAVTWQQNKDKWEQAKRFCDSKGYEFHILTERHLKHGF